MKYRETLLETKEILTDIQNEITNQNEFSALLLAHGYIEAYLREWFFISGNISKETFNKQTIKDIERFSFTYVLYTHLVLGNITYSLFKQISSFNQKRNVIAHEIIKINRTHTKTKKSLHSSIQISSSIIKQLAKKYQQSLNKYQKSIRA
ncbi:MAG: hypothetical protein ACMXYD_02450 [Candidatus Woesearchaeota archaeon]